MFDNVIHWTRHSLNTTMNWVIALQTSRRMASYRVYPADKTALLLLDTQNGFLQGSDELIARYQALIDHARASQYSIVYSLSGSGIDVVFPTTARLDIARQLNEGPAGCDIPPAIAAQPDDVVLSGRTRFSAFSDVRLQAFLTNNAIEHLVIAGPLTNTTLDSTVRDGVQLDLHVTVLTGFYPQRDSYASRAELKFTLPRYAHHVMNLAKFKSVSS